MLYCDKCTKTAMWYIHAVNPGKRSGVTEWAGLACGEHREAVSSEVGQKGSAFDLRMIIISPLILQGAA